MRKEGKVIADICLRDHGASESLSSLEEGVLGGYVDGCVDVSIYEI